MDIKRIDFDSHFERLSKVPKAARYGAVAAVLTLIGAGYYFLFFTEDAALLTAQQSRAQVLQRKLTNVRAVANNVGEFEQEVAALERELEIAGDGWRPEHPDPQGNPEVIGAMMPPDAADRTDSPVIVQASAGARKYAGAPFLRHLIQAAVEEFPHIPVVMHQDHGTSPGVCQRSIQLGFSSVMMDGSLKEDGKTPADYAYNMDITRRVTEMAHACGVSVEALSAGVLPAGLPALADAAAFLGVPDPGFLGFLDWVSARPAPLPPEDFLSLMRCRFPPE